jgi:hypothetical protein
MSYYVAAVRCNSSNTTDISTYLKNMDTINLFAGPVKYNYTGMFFTFFLKIVFVIVMY